MALINNNNHSAEHRDEDRYFDLKRLSEYSGLCVRTLTRHMADPDHPLPNHYVRVGAKARGKIMVSKKAFDRWVATFPPYVDAVADPEDGRWVRALAK